MAYLNARGPEAGASGDIGIRVRHWTRYFDICRVCDVNWSFVGKVESIVEDAAYMLKQVNLSKVVEYPYYRFVSSCLTVASSFLSVIVVSFLIYNPKRIELLERGDI